MTNKTASEIAMMEKDNLSKKVREMLGLPLHSWENLMLVSLVGAAVAAVFVVVSTYAVVQLQRHELSTSKDEFERYKLKAGVEIAKAAEGAARASERAEEASARAAEANEKAERERLARVKIEEKLAPRHLSSEQKAVIAQRLSIWGEGSGIKQSAAVFPTSSSFESGRLADEIADVLKDAGWDINRNPVTFGMSYSVSGIGLLTSSNPRGIAVADALAKALNTERLLTFVIPEKRSGCEEMDMSHDLIASNPWCSQISVFVGDHP